MNLSRKWLTEFVDLSLEEYNDKAFAEAMTVSGSKVEVTEDLSETIKNVKVSAGAGFIVVLTGDILTMPGLPKVPAAEKIDVDENGKITGLF